MIKKNSQGGFIALLALLISVLIVGFWFVKSITENGVAIKTPPGLEGDPRGTNVIDSAMDVKTLYETKNGTAPEE